MTIPVEDCNFFSPHVYLTPPLTVPLEFCNSSVAKITKELHLLGGPKFNDRGFRLDTIS